MSLSGRDKEEVAIGPARDEKQRSVASGYGQRDSDRYFRMPLHYPRFKKADYDSMPAWKLDLLLRQYGLFFIGDLPHKRKFAIETFLWPDEY